MLPKFKYHPDPLGTEMFRQDEPKTCCCCGRQTEIWYDGPFDGDWLNPAFDRNADEHEYEKMDYSSNTSESSNSSGGNRSSWKTAPSLPTVRITGRVSTRGEDEIMYRY